MADTGWPTAEVALRSVLKPEITLSVHETRIEWGHGTSDATRITLACDPIPVEQQAMLAGVPHVWLKLHGLPNKTVAWRSWAWSGFCASLTADDEGRTVAVFVKDAADA